MSESCATSTQLRFLDLLNDLRRRRGLAALRVDASLQAAAIFRAGDMVARNYFAHDTPGRGSAHEVVEQFGYDGDLTGENICWGENTAEEAFDTWVDSAPHFENMVSPHYAAIGIGGQIGTQGQQAKWGMWATAFGSALEREAPACHGDVAPIPQPGDPAGRPPREERVPREKPPREVRRARRAGRREEMEMGENRDREREREREQREREREQREREREQRERERRQREQEREQRERERHAATGTSEGPSPTSGTSPTTSPIPIGGALPVVAGGLGAPTGTVPRGRIGGGGPWERVNRFDATFVAEGRKHGVPPAMLKSMMIVETGGKNVSDGHGATGVMQIKPVFWSDLARAAGYDLGTDEGQIGMAAAIVGGSVPNVRGTTPLERFLSTYYPIPGGLDVPGESGHTQRMYLDDIAFYSRLIDEAGAGAVAAAAGSTPAVESTAEIQFGRVPHPAFQDRLIPDANNRAWNDLGPRHVKGVVYHRQLSPSNWGTDGYFRAVPPGGAGACPEPNSQFNWGGCNGLTDYGVDDETGDILMWNDPTGAAHPAVGVSANRSPWASGPVRAPYGNGLAFLQDHGMDENVVNRDQASIEISGFYRDPVTGIGQDEPISEACKDAVAALSAYFADQSGIPWHQYPTVPGKTYSFVRWHQEFTIGTGKICPGPDVMDATPDIVARTKEILRRHQTAGGPAAEIPVVPPPESRLSKLTLPAGVTVDDLRKWFGEHFDPNGAVTVAWAEQGVRTGLFPRLVRLDPAGPVRDFEFENGMKIRADQSGVRVIGGTS